MQFVKTFFLLVFVFLCGCASSDLSRNAASNIDTTYQNIMSNHVADNDPVDAYQNASQVGKGALIGGAAGALAGSVTSGLGVLPGAAGGAFVGGVIGAYVEGQTNIVDQLENRGVKIIILGDQILIVLQSDRIFNTMSANIRTQAYSTLDMVAYFIRHFTSMSIKVAAYTNDAFPCQISRALTQQQAEKIVKYLWPRVNTRLMSAFGYGGSHIVESNNLAWGDNYRIEITLEKLPV